MKKENGKHVVVKHTTLVDVSMLMKQAGTIDLDANLKDLAKENLKNKLAAKQKDEKKEEKKESSVKKSN